MPPNWSRTCKCGRYLSVHWPEHPHAWKNGYVYAHRAKLEEALGSFLPKGIHVHHRDGNPRNNDISNLVAITPLLHSKEHLVPAKTVRRTCARCRRSFTRAKRQDHGFKNSYCSRTCFRLRKRP
jgi:hypothetical protein